ncbi:hypothetical protein BO71DRAFT_483487 [Aspergillus ellipticus CBS 707.79]|uniref:Uncharacterized protein n=1 Tax=Aspergillus ellipticus CBS 707.79 TaxID=1448320 RepID=A0A319DBP4_9EURO|nr:hypothetical protein BO71DRAFT_483487 [Aspergillus ellipticus CBS 707.79]
MAVIDSKQKVLASSSFPDFTSVSFFPRSGHGCSSASPFISVFEVHSASSPVHFQFTFCFIPFISAIASLLSLGPDLVLLHLGLGYLISNTTVHSVRNPTLTSIKMPQFSILRPRRYRWCVVCRRWGHDQHECWVNISRMLRAASVVFSNGTVVFQQGTRLTVNGNGITVETLNARRRRNRRRNSRQRQNRPWDHGVRFGNSHNNNNNTNARVNAGRLTPVRQVPMSSTTNTSAAPGTSSSTSIQFSSGNAGPSSAPNTQPTALAQSFPPVQHQENRETVDSDVGMKVDDEEDWENICDFGQVSG